MPDQGWPTRRLADVATWMSGGTPSTDNFDYWGGDVPWISAASLRDFNIENSDRCLTALGAASGTRLAPKGATIFVVRGMSLKSELRVGIAQRPVAFGQDCKALVPHDDVDPRYLAWAVKASAPQILTMVDEAGHGTGRLETGLVARHRIGVPPLAEQRRIAEIFDALDEQIQTNVHFQEKSDVAHYSALRELADPVLRELRNIAPSQLAYLDRLPRHAPWTVTNLGSQLKSIEAGMSPSLEDRPAKPGEWGILKVSAVKRSGFKADENKVVESPGFINSSIEVRDGDLLITRSNTSELVGQSCVVSNPRAGLMLCDKTLRLRVRENSGFAAFVNEMLAMPEVRRQIEISATGTSGSMKNVSQSAVRRLMIPWADLATQTQVVDLVQAQQRTRQAQIAALAKLRGLKQALMGDLLTGRVRVPVGGGV